MAVRKDNSLAKLACAVRGSIKLTNKIRGSVKLANQVRGSVKLSNLDSTVDKRDESGDFALELPSKQVSRHRDLFFRVKENQRK